MSRLVVVVPVRNEAKSLPALLARLGERIDPRRVVVSDCNSTDDTAAVACAAGASVVRGEGVTGRGTALRAGYAAAVAAFPHAAVVWFLHADSRPPGDWPDQIAAVLARPRVVAGAFPLRFEMRGLNLTYAQRRALAFVLLLNRTRYRCTGCYFGDQGLFARADALAELVQRDAFPTADLFEDVALCAALRRVGRVRLARARMTTSPRRFVDAGVLRQLGRDASLLLRYHLGRDLTSAAQRYNAASA